MTVDSASGDFAHRTAAERMVLAGISGLASLAIALDSEFPDSFGPARVFLALVALLALLALLQRRLRISREAGMYGAFVGYLLVASTWAPDRVLTLNTLFPAV